MFQIPPYSFFEPACFIQYQSGEIQDLTLLCKQGVRRREEREKAERNLTPEQRQLIEQQRRLLQEQTERSRKLFDDLLRQNNPIP